MPGLIRGGRSPPLTTPTPTQHWPPHNTGPLPLTAPSPSQHLPLSQHLPPHNTHTLTTPAPSQYLPLTTPAPSQYLPPPHSTRPPGIRSMRGHPTGMHPCFYDRIIRTKPFLILDWKWVWRTGFRRTRGIRLWRNWRIRRDTFGNWVHNCLHTCLHRCLCRSYLHSRCLYSCVRRFPSVSHFVSYFEKNSFKLIATRCKFMLYFQKKQVKPRYLLKISHLLPPA